MRVDLILQCFELSLFCQNFTDIILTDQILSLTHHIIKMVMQDTDFVCPVLIGMIDFKGKRITVRKGIHLFHKHGDI